jgi:hypothetical protein
MSGPTLTAPQTKKLDGALAPFVDGLSEKDAVNVHRYADKWARWKLGVRATGPHAHGLDVETRTAIQAALVAAYGIKADS